MEAENTAEQQAAPPKTVAIGGKDMSLEDATEAARGAARWFWWIAGLSAINTVALYFWASRRAS
ncbi:MAG: hypothetical protein ACE5F8_01430 [Woeseiaceae bacterium]